MSIFSKIKYKKFREYVDIIDWTSYTSDILIWPFPRFKAEIKNGAQLTVSKTQVAVLVSDGQFADVYHPGTYKLTTENMPILATLKRWKYGFDSPFKVDVYFVNTKQFWNIDWATDSSIVMHDSEFENTSMQATGIYCFQVKSNPIKFIRNVGGTEKNFTTESATIKLQSFAISKFTDYLAISKISILDLVSNLNEFSSELTIALKNDFSDYGLNLMKFSVKEIILPENVRKVIDKRIEKNNLKKRSTYTQKTFTDSLVGGSNNLTDAGSHPRNAMGIGIGLTRAKRMAQEMTDYQDDQRTAVQSDKTIDANVKEVPRISQQALYYIAISGVQQGPFRKIHLQQMVVNGQLTPDTLVWTMGMAGWERAKSIPSISELFSKAPPPL
ncbi:MAG: DUF4339 domain-containing protein [Bacteroidales bacterium]|nr:DUF4339 domain-containing protein [Bacteroidales bacterium]